MSNESTPPGSSSTRRPPDGDTDSGLPSADGFLAADFYPPPHTTSGVCSGVDRGGAAAAGGGGRRGRGCRARAHPRGAAGDSTAEVGGLFDMFVSVYWEFPAETWPGMDGVVANRATKGRAPTPVFISAVGFVGLRRTDPSTESPPYGTREIRRGHHRRPPDPSVPPTRLMASRVIIDM